MPKATYKKRKDGRYRLKYKGEQIYASTISAATAIRNERIRDVENGLIQQTLGTKFGEYALQWIETYKDSCSDRTYNAYVSIVNHAIDVIGDRRMKNITKMDIQKLMNGLKGYSTSTVKKFRMTLNSIFTAAVHDKVIISNPCYGVKLPKSKSGTHRVITDEERELIHASVGKHDMALAAMVMLYAGLRRGEVLALDYTDIDLEAGVIKVSKGIIYNGNRPIISTPKTEAGNRSVPIIEPLKSAFEGMGGRVLCDRNGGIMSETAFSRKWGSYITYLETQMNGCQKRWYGNTKEHKRIIRSGGTLPPWRECTIRTHDLRHSYVTMLFEAGVDIKTARRWVGHSGEKMIIEIYTHLREQKEQTSQQQLSNYVEKWLTGSKRGSNDESNTETVDL